MNLKNKIKINKDNIPNHVGIIMDGNSRWAKKKLLPKKFGHKEGVNRFEDVINVALDLKIKSLTVYAFSTENWNRSKNEVDYLMKSIIDFEKKHFEKINKKNIKIKIIGSRDDRIPKLVLKAINRMEDASNDNKSLTFYIAFNYGGQDEIVRTCNKLIKNKIEITIENISKNLDTEYDKLDLLIRTSGEERLSNFLIWQNSYSEFIFVDTLWPDFNKKEFKKTIKIYQKRNRRFGAR